MSWNSLKTFVQLSRVIESGLQFACTLLFLNRWAGKLWASMVNLPCYCGPWAAEHVVAMQSKCKSEHEHSFSAVKLQSVHICVDNNWVLALRKLDQNLLFGLPGMLWAKFSATYVMRCAYPVCPDIQARIFPQHPPTTDISPMLSDG